MTPQSRFLTLTFAAFSLPALAAAQTLVVGTGNPDIDLAAVQAAVDRGGSVTLKGHFSFDRPPGRRGSMPDLTAMVLVTNAVTISGAWDESGQTAVIEGGESPFAVEAPGGAVKIENLRFVHPKLFAIMVSEVTGLTIERCVIENVIPRTLPGTAGLLTSGLGIYISTVMGLPTPERMGAPGNVSGKISIRDNRISGVGAADHGIGIMLVNLGDDHKPVDVEISGNTVRDSSRKGINVTQIAGNARIERNTVSSAVVYSGPDNGGGAGIHCGGSGSYLVANNVIEIADPNYAGIRVRAFPLLGAAVDGAIVVDNAITMSADKGAEFGNGNAGIQIMGLVRNAVVQRNRVQGRARIGLSVVSDKTGNPSNSTVDQNDAKSLQSLETSKASRQ